MCKLGVSILLIVAWGCFAFTDKLSFNAKFRLKQLHSQVAPSPLNPTENHDLWIVGAGVLGKLVGISWLKKRKASSIVAECRSMPILCKSLPKLPYRMRSQRTSNTAHSASNVLISIPPTGYSDEEYLSEIVQACEIWKSSEEGGKMIFISSTAVYGDQITGIVEESSPLDVNGPARTKLMIQAEATVLQHKGCILRLAGLYTKDRGAHSYWLSKGLIQGTKNGLVNLLHYEDAASAVLAAITSGVPGSVYLASDGCPTTREAICQSAIDSGLFHNPTMPKFTETSDMDKPVGKQCDDSWTRQALGWRPKYGSFSSFMQQMKLTSLHEPFELMCL